MMIVDKDVLLDFFARYAPEAPIGRCTHYANEYAENKKEIYFLKEALAVLAEEVIGFTPNGEIPKGLTSRRPSVKWALEKVQNAHAWVVCGPSGGMKSLLEQIDKEINETGKRRSI
jgi:hypothetical protein